MWAALVGVSAVAAGLAAGAIALVGFGADSITDGLASAVLVWRFRAERSGGGSTQLVEHRAARTVGAILIMIALYVSASAVAALVHHSAPDRSTVGLVLTAASLAVLPVLARAKLRLSVRLNSQALKGDGLLSLAGALLAGITLLSLALHAAFGWWWSDAACALVVAAFLLRAGWQTSTG